jgi:fatty acid amide hydrolase 2
LLNFADLSKCTGPIPPGFELFPHVLRLWATLTSSDPAERSFLDFMSEGHPGGRMRPLLELAKWFHGTSEHTMMSIGLTLVELFEKYLTPKSVKQKNLLEAHDFRKAINRELGENGIIVSPTYPSPAPKHHQPTWFTVRWQYTGAFNVAWVPAVAVPVWTPDVAAVKVAPSRREDRARSVSDDHHLPKGVQVVASWGNDSLAIQVAVEMERGGFAQHKLPHWAAAE